MNGKIGIILINYNGRRDTLECIKSIKKSTYSNYVIIVVDNHSNLEERISDCENLEGVVVRILGENIGFGAANNVGAEIALKEKAEFLLCLNNDTVVSPDFLERMVSAYEKNTVLTCRINDYSSRDKIWYGGGKTSKVFGTFRHQKFSMSRYVSFVCGCCFLMPADIYRKIGLFSEQFFMYCEDSDLLVRLLKNGYRIKYVSDAVIWHKIGRSADRIKGLKLYYTTRNRLIVLRNWKDYFCPLSWMYFYVTRFLLVLFLFITGRETGDIRQGIMDYQRGIEGKREKL